MRRWMIMAAVLGAMLSSGGGAARQAAHGPAAPIEVMVLGSWHFDNPGQDLNNMHAADVRTSRRQAELEATARALAAFRPTRIMIERQVVASDLVDHHYDTFTLAQLAEQRDERVQIAYRLAHMLGLRQVYGIDERQGEGEPDYFPFDAVAAYARAHGQQPLVDGLIATGAAEVRRLTEMQSGHSIAEMLIEANRADDPAQGIGPYYELLRVGDTEAQPGAELNAMWYLRNAKIFAKLESVARPGDRVLVVFGSGHDYWLRHFAGATPGFRNADPAPYLRRAARRR